MMVNQTLAARSILLLALFYFGGVSAAAQDSKTPGESNIQQSLLDEVRLLRETLQRMNLHSYRAQIVIERMRAQNERVMRLTRLLEESRDEAANMQLHVSQLSDRLKLVEGQLQQEADSKQRAQLEMEQRDLKYGLDQQRLVIDRTRDREARLNSELQVEQGKLSDLEARLDALEREIENEIDRQRPADQVKPARRRPQ
jgi:predicted  nucleic acid-binding Zn-ribbon protein